MSDFLGRIAARAVGAPALARPQLPAQPGGTAGGGLEVVDEEVVVPGTASTAIPERPSEVAHAAAASPKPVPAPPTTTEWTAPVRPATAPTDRPSESPHSAVLLQTPELAAASHAEPVPAAQPAEAPAPVTAIAVPATPAAPALTVPVAPAPPAAAATARDESPPVRVRIGRLEVRANLTEAPRPEPRPERPEPEGPSLSDYLQGKRGA